MAALAELRPCRAVFGERAKVKMWPEACKFHFLPADRGQVSGYKPNRNADGLSACLARLTTPGQTLSAR